jgi:hypothetical protein
VLVLIEAFRRGGSPVGKPRAKGLPQRYAAWVKRVVKVLFSYLDRFS